MRVCYTHLFNFFFSCFRLVNDLSLDFRFLFFAFVFGNAYDFVLFLLPFVSLCCMHLYFMFTAEVLPLTSLPSQVVYFRNPRR